MSDWEDWRREHAAALAALQDAQRAYHRAAVGRQAGSSRPAVDSPQSPDGSQPAPLDALDEARSKLDEVRKRMPR